MIAPRDRMMSLVSGIAGDANRRGRLFMAAVYQAFIDDSGAGQPGAFVLAGFVASAESWATFSDEWAAALLTPRPIAYFKTNEASTLRGQFCGWTPLERDELIGRLIAIIERHALFGIGCLIHNEEYRAVFKKKISKTMDYPYTLAFYGVMQSLFIVQHNNGTQQPVDFIFDEQGKQIGKALTAWKYFAHFAQEENRSRLGRPPVASDDKVDLPLQAADMLAWRIRRESVDARSGNDWAHRLVPFQSIYRHVHVWTKEALESQMAALHEFKRITGRKFLYDR